MKVAHSMFKGDIVSWTWLSESSKSFR